MKTPVVEGPEGPAERLASSDGAEAWARFLAPGATVGVIPREYRNSVNGLVDLWAREMRKREKGERLPISAWYDADTHHLEME